MSTEPGSVQTYADLKHKIDPSQIKVADPVVEETELVVKSPWDLADYPDSRAQWGEQYGVCSTFLPFAYLSCNPVQITRDVGKFLNQLPPTKQRVSTSALYSACDFSGGGPRALSFDDICLIFGWWRGGETPASGPYYCNPEYVHDHPESDYIDPMTYWDDESGEYVNDRLDFALRAARLGRPGPVVSQAFGLVDDGAAGRWLNRRNFGWKQQYEAGRQRMFRTAKTINAWGYTHDEIAQAFGISNSSVSRWTSQFAADFEPPADPSYQVVSAGGGE